MSLSVIRSLAATVLLLLSTIQGQATEAFPSRPVKIILPTPAGGNLDGIMRRLADRLAPLLGQPVLIENKPGGSGIVAISSLLAAPADGHSIAVGLDSTLIIAPLTQDKLSFNVERDLTPVSRFSGSSIMLSVAGSSGIRHFADLVRLVKAHPGTVSYGGATVASQFVGEALRKVAGLDAVYIPYPGGPAMYRAQLAGDVLFTFDGVGFERAMVESGKLRPLALAAEQRSALAPQVPTFAELGYPGIVATPKIGLVARSGTPRDRVLKLNAAVNTVLRDPTFVSAAIQAGQELAEPAEPERYWRDMARDRALWSHLIERSGVPRN